MKRTRTTKRWRCLAMVLALPLIVGCDLEARTAMAQGSEQDSDVERNVRLGNGAVRLATASDAHVEVSAVAEGGHAASLHAPARLEFREGAVTEIHAPIEARIARLHVQVGETVRTGQPLMTLGGPAIAQLRAEVERARIGLLAAQSEADRQESLFERGVGVARERLEAELALAQAGAELASIEQAVEFIRPVDDSPATAVVHAPIDGTVLAMRATLGSAVDPDGEPLIVVGDLEGLWAVAHVFEGDLWRIQPGDSARLEIGSANRQLVGGRVLKLGPAVDQDLRHVPVYVELEPTATHLRAGTYARVTFLSGELESFSLPRSAVVLEDRRHIVYVQTAERTYEPREVVVSETIDGHLQVLQGLQGGESVVVRGALLLDQIF